MSFFDKFKRQTQSVEQQSQQSYIESTPIQQQTGLLNLQKNDILNLSKGLSNVKLASGWNINHLGQDYDLDLCAMLMTDTNRVQDTVYYGKLKARGLELLGDNLVGSNVGDAETMLVNLEEVNSSITKIVFSVVIYKGSNRRQSFEHVRNAYVRLVDMSDRQENEICRYNLSEDGGDNTAIVFASLNRTVSGWQFQAIGNYTHASISDLVHRLPDMNI